MAFPFGGHSHHHHHQRREDEDEEDRGGSPFSRPPSYPHHHEHYPPPGTSPFYPPPPLHYPPAPPPSFPPTVEHVAHDSHRRHPDPPPPPHFFPPRVEHVAHESHVFPRPHGPSHDPHPHLPFPHHHRHPLPRGEDVRVFCEAETDYSLTIRDGSVVLARSNPSDEFQHWIKDEKYSTKVKDEERFPSFALVNKATGQALQHAIGATQPVRLTAYRPDEFDQSILWTMSKDVGRGFRTIRMVNNIRLNLDAFNGDKNHGGVHDGTVAVLWEWKKGENQRWKLVPY